MLEPQNLTGEKCLYCHSPSHGEIYCCAACETLHQQVIPQKVQGQIEQFKYLDQNNFREQYIHHNQEFPYHFYVEGLHCSSCVHLLEKLPEFYSEILEARVNYAYSTVSVALSEKASLAQVAAVIHELGYVPHLLAPQDDFLIQYQNENRTSLKRIAVAGACAGNIMLFVIPVYAGLAGQMGQLFNWISFILYLPILFYSAVPFYKGAWNSLKYRLINVDLPITIAMLSSVFFSLYNLIRGDANIYFDSTASFMFLILSARYVLKRVQQNYLAPSQIQNLLKADRFELIDGEQIRVVSHQEIERGQVFRVDREQILPVDAELVKNVCVVNTSLFDGESLPKTFNPGMTIFAGMQILTPQCEFRSLSNSHDSRLGILFKQLDQSAVEKTNFVSLTDKLAQRLIMSVFAIAAAFFFIYSWVDVSVAFNRALALIVLACPCALAFGSPLTFGLALKKAQRLGILMKSGTVLEKIQKIRHIFFDKTGTLTNGELTLIHTEPAMLDDETKQIILSLENSSYHPIAFALRSAWKELNMRYPVSESEELIGKGVRGRMNNDLYEICALSESIHTEEYAVEVRKNNLMIARLYFNDLLRPESHTAIKELQNRGLHCYLLSGDKKSRAQQIALSIGIQEKDCHAELFPEDKLTILSKYKDTCMIGDGANDSLALKNADIGIAVKGSVDLSMQNADVYFTKGGLYPLFELITLAEQTKTTLYRNLTISLIYNSIGGTLALLGFINPMMAAILMPISSLIIVLSSLWGFR